MKFRFVWLLSVSLGLSGVAFAEETAPEGTWVTRQTSEGISVAETAGSESIAILLPSRGEHFKIKIIREEWKAQAGSGLAIRFSFSGGDTFTFLGTKWYSIVNVEIPDDQLKSFIHNFSAMSEMTLDFPQTHETSTHVTLSGSTASINAMSALIDNIGSLNLPPPFARAPIGTSADTTEKQAATTKTAEADVRHLDAAQTQEQDQAENQAQVRNQAGITSSDAQLLQKIKQELPLALSILPAGYADAKIFINNLAGGSRELVTFKVLIGLMMYSGEYTSVRVVSAYDGKLFGVRTKRPGLPAGSIIFKREDDELYLYAMGSDDQVEPIRPEQREFVEISLFSFLNRASAKAKQNGH